MTTRLPARYIIRWMAEDDEEREAHPRDLADALAMAAEVARVYVTEVVVIEQHPDGCGGFVNRRVGQ